MKGPIVLLSLGVVLVAGSLGYEFLMPSDSNNTNTTIATNETTAPTSSQTSIQQKQKLKKRDILSYVPADSLLFFGGIESTKFQDMLKVSLPEEGWIDQVDWAALDDEDDLSNPPPPGLSFLEGLFIEYMKALQSPDTAAKSLGIKEEFDSTIYTVGAIPVLRFSLDNSDDFLAFLDRAEQAKNMTHTKQTLDGLSLRSYRLDDKKNKDKNTALELIITIQNNYAVITFAIPEENRDTLLELALGINKPSLSLADNSTLQDLKEKYNFHPGYFGYIDHTIIVKGLTNPESNQFGRMIDGFIKASLEKDNTLATNETTPPKEHPLANIQTSSCERELTKMVNTWPRSVTGYTKLSLDKQPMELQAIGVIEVNDQALLKSLKTLRGYIPAHLRNANSKTLFGFGLGFNMDALLPFLTKTFQDILQTPYECTPLKDIKQQLAASNGTAAIGMASGMLASLQGISASIFNIDGNIDLATKTPNIKSVDAMITLSAGNPQSFVMMAANFIPPLASLTIPADGTAIDLPIPLPIPLADTPKIAIKGNHIVAYIGEQSRQHAENLANSPLEQNAVLAFNVDHGQYLKLLSTVGEMEANKSADPVKKQELEALSKAMGSVKTQMNQLMDFTDQGISMEANIIVN